MAKEINSFQRAILKKLIKKGYILQKPTYYGLEVSINPKMIQEISDIIKC